MRLRIDTFPYVGSLLCQANKANAIVPSISGKRKFTCHHCAQFFCRNCFDLFFLVSASSSAATSSSNEETTYSGDGAGAGRYVRESNGEATLTLPRGFKVCGECFRELNSDAERESSKGDDEEAEDEYLVAELELLGGGKRTLSADATDGNTTMNIDAPREGK